MSSYTAAHSAGRYCNGELGKNLQRRKFATAGVLLLAVDATVACWVFRTLSDWLVFI